MRSHDRVALPAVPPRSSAGSSMDHLQQPAGPAPAEGKGASAKVELSQHVGATAAPCGCQPGRWPYMAPYCPPMLPLQCLRPSVEEGRIGEAWAEPVLPAHEPVVATTGAEPLASPVTRPGRLARDWMEPASMQATGVADVSAGSRPMHRHRPTSSSSTRILKMLRPSLRLQWRTCTSTLRKRRADLILHPAQVPRGRARPMDQ